MEVVLQGFFEEVLTNPCLCWSLNRLSRASIFIFIYFLDDYRVTTITSTPDRDIQSSVICPPTPAQSTRPYPNSARQASHQVTCEPPKWSSTMLQAGVLSSRVGSNIQHKIGRRSNQYCASTSIHHDTIGSRRHFQCQFGANRTSD